MQQWMQMEGLSQQQMDAMDTGEVLWNYRNPGYCNPSNRKLP